MQLLAMKTITCGGMVDDAIEEGNFYPNGNRVPENMSPGLGPVTLQR